MNVLLINASPRNGLSRQYLDRFAARLSGHAVSAIDLRKLDIKECVGCNNCFIHGEAKCPYRADDCAKVEAAMLAADCIVFFIPNYSLQVPARLKMLFDRLAYVFHRPRLFGKKSACFVTEGVYGGADLRAYLKKLMGFWGAVDIGGAVLKGSLGRDMPADAQAAADKAFDVVIKRLESPAARWTHPRPSLFRLAIFRMTRSSMRHFAEATPADKAYFQEHGWLESAYFYPTRLGPVKSLAGALLDSMMKGMAAKAAKTPVPPTA